MIPFDVLKLQRSKTLAHAHLNMCIRTFSLTEHPDSKHLESSDEIFKGRGRGAPSCGVNNVKRD